MADRLGGSRERLLAAMIGVDLRWMLLDTAKGHDAKMLMLDFGIPYTTRKRVPCEAGCGVIGKLPVWIFGENVRIVACSEGCANSALKALLERKERER